MPDSESHSCASHWKSVCGMTVSCSRLDSQLPRLSLIFSTQGFHMHQSLIFFISRVQSCCCSEDQSYVKHKHVYNCKPSSVTMYVLLLMATGYLCKSPTKQGSVSIFLILDVILFNHFKIPDVRLWCLYPGKWMKWVSHSVYPVAKESWIRTGT